MVALEQTLARKAIVDAANDGVLYFRVSVTGYAPSSPGGRSDLALWLKDPARYWAAMDSMMDDMSHHNIKIIATLMFNPVQFPSMTGEKLADLINNPHSRSWQLLARYVTEFITRYRGKNLILLYEMTNELNVSADIDFLGYCKKVQTSLSCEAVSNFTSSELIAFSKRFYDLIKGLDPAVPVSTGFALPRRSAEHLHDHPAFLTGKADWTPDTMTQAEDNLAAMNKYADVLSVHIYPDSRFGDLSAEHPLALIDSLNREAIALGKPLFIGEFGEKDPGKAQDRSFVDEMLKAIAEKRVPYSALWVWEFYQRTTYLTYDTTPTLYNLEPGYTDDVIQSLKQANTLLTKQYAPVAQNFSPEVVITWPLDCQTVTGPFVSYAVASSGGKAVSKVEFRLDGTLLQTVPHPPFRAEVHFAHDPSGPHQLTAIAYGKDGQQSHYTIRLNPEAQTGACVAYSKATH